MSMAFRLIPERHTCTTKLEPFIGKYFITSCNKHIYFIHLQARARCLIYVLEFKLKKYILYFIMYKT